MKKPIICITGGHLTPALAVIEEIRKYHPDWKMVFFGRRSAFENGTGETQEERLVNSLGIPFFALTTGKQGISIWKVPGGLIQALFMLLKTRPSLVLSFGGYIAFPVVIAAWMLKIPVVTHEQTQDLGLANRLTSPLAHAVILSNDTGVPIRQSLMRPPAKPSFTVDLSRPIIYITGGSTGATTLNALVFPIVEKLIPSFTIIHQTGISDRRKAPAISSRYIVSGYFDTPDLAWIYHHTSLLVGRAGANTVAEVSALGIPAIFIPLPWSARGEQEKNAQKAKNEGFALVLDQKDLTADGLLFCIRKTMISIAGYRKRAKDAKENYPRTGASVVLAQLERIITPSS